jgi:Double zinc ribbon
VTENPRFCSSCGHALDPGDSFCSNCGAQVTVAAAQPVHVEPDATQPPAGGSNLVPCPGCVQTWGVPGALCPACGSRYGDPTMKAPAQALGIAGVVLIGIALLINGVSESAANVIGGIGVLALLGAAGAYAAYSGRVGPQRQSSCCGCSCAIALLVIPVTGLALWQRGGPELAVLALPAWWPISWALSLGEQGARTALGVISRRN